MMLTFLGYRYEFLEKQIRENGAQWLKEEAEEQEKMMA